MNEDLKNCKIEVGNIIRKYPNCRVVIFDKDLTFEKALMTNGGGV